MVPGEGIPWCTVFKPCRCYQTAVHFCLNVLRSIWVSLLKFRNLKEIKIKKSRAKKIKLPSGILFVTFISTVKVGLFSRNSYKAIFPKKHWFQRFTHFVPSFSFCTPWRHQKTRDFLIFSGGCMKRLVAWNGLIGIIIYKPVN